MYNEYDYDDEIPFCRQRLKITMEFYTYEEANKRGYGRNY